MASRKDLKPSISDLSDNDIETLIAETRAARRTEQAKGRARRASSGKKRKKGKKKKPVDNKKLLRDAMKSMTKEQKLKILNELTE